MARGGTRGRSGTTIHLTVRHVVPGWWGSEIEEPDLVIEQSLNVF